MFTWLVKSFDYYFWAKTVRQVFVNKSVLSWGQQQLWARLNILVFCSSIPLSDNVTKDMQEDVAIDRGLN